MTARAMWKGSLELDGFSVPFKLFAAASDPSAHFRMVEAKTLRPVRQQMVHPGTGEPVPSDRVKKGMRRGDQMVLFTPEELERLTPEASREVHVSRVVGIDALGPECFLRPYYLGPDGQEDAYFALARALAGTATQALCHWVMRNTSYGGALRAEGPYLALFTLRADEDVLKPGQLPVPEGPAHTDKELKMAEQLVRAFSDAFDPSQYRDNTEERVRALLEEKAKGHVRRAAPKPLKKAREPDLSAALAESLKVAKKREQSVA